MAQPSMKQLDNYIGCFYEDNIEKQIEATKNILVLLLDFKNILNILEHQSLLQMLSRMLQEEHKKSIELCVYLQCIFYVLANYTPFHEYLTQFQVGKATMDIIEYQIDRFDIRYSEYIELWKQNGGQRTQQTDVELRKLNYLISKQDKLFFLCINILMNLGEDPMIEKKMRKNGIIKTLIRMLERNDFHLLVVTLLFLKKLSIFAEGKDQMIQLNLIQKLSRFFSCENDMLLDLALGLYKNLSFDDIAKDRIQKNGLIPKFIELLHGTNRFNAIVILYILSINEQIRFTLAYTELMELVIKLITHFPEKIIGQELIALAINLSCNKRNVEHISQEDLHGLADRALKNQDTRLLKFCKNVWKNSDNTDIIGVGKGLMKQFSKILLTKSKNQDLVMQVLGVLSVLKFGSSWKQFLNQNITNFIDKQLTNGIAEDDIVMETVMVISNICQDEVAAEILSKTNIFKSLMGLFLDKTDDPQFCIQILYAIYMFLYHKLCFDDIFDEGQVLMRLLLLVDDPHEPLRKMNDEVLNQLRQYNQIDVLESIKERKFIEYNKQWLKSTQEYGSHQMDQYAMFDAYVDNDELDPRMWESEDDYD